MERRIIIETGAREELRSLFGVTDKMVSNALNYRSNTELAKKIRVVALQKGAIVAGLPEMQTTFTSNGDMVQTWGDKARLVAKRESDEVQVYIDGELDREYKSMKVAELMQEQHRISLLVASR